MLSACVVHTNAKGYTYAKGWSPGDMGNSTVRTLNQHLGLHLQITESTMKEGCHDARHTIFSTPNTIPSLHLRAMTVLHSNTNETGHRWTEMRVKLQASGKLLAQPRRKMAYSYTHIIICTYSHSPPHISCEENMVWTGVICLCECVSSSGTRQGISPLAA